ncbi:MAG: hypothetical protein DDT24_00740 [Chloroflexi bacterium]|nr:hypothetical protein [Chloroflexota bacterium]
MKSAKYLIILLAAVLLALPILSSSPVSAAPGFGVSPPVLMVSIAPGESTDHTIIVVNEAGPPMDLIVEMKGLGQSANGSFKPLVPDEDQSPYSARTFISSISPSEFHLATASSQEIEVVIDVPGNIGGGSRYAIIYISSKPTPGHDGADIAVAIATPVVVTISGTEPSKTGHISDFTIGERVDGLVDIRATLKNTGNHHYRARAEAVLKDGKGNKLATASTPLTHSSILPGFTRQFDLSLAPGRELPSGAYIDLKIELEDGTVLYSKRRSLDPPTDRAAFIGIGAAVVVGVVTIIGRRSIRSGIDRVVARVMRRNRQGEGSKQGEIDKRLIMERLIRD